MRMDNEMQKAVIDADFYIKLPGDGGSGCTPHYA